MIAQERQALLGALELEASLVSVLKVEAISLF
jgi:hypothetical protein